LFKSREKRPHSTKDDKILVDWNGLMIAALAKASNVFDEPKHLQTGIKAAGFILEKLQDAKGTLCHRYAKGEKAIEGFLDDYAFFVWGLIEIYEACFEEKYLQIAVELTDNMISRFWDDRDGGFYFTTKSAERAMPRIKQVYDGALPSGNSVALLNLLRLSLLTGNAKYRELASQVIRVFSEDLKRSPTAHAFMLIGVDFAIGPAYNIIIIGSRKEDNIQSILGALKTVYLPNKGVSLRLSDKTGLGYEKIEGKATVYVCRGQTCLPPTNEAEKMLELLDLA
jgi:uncharacterized protein YyaL (SSP411 family)